MAQKSHVFCTPFPGAGHAVNMFNVATVLATPAVNAHILVMSMNDGQRWMKATGQVQNPDVHLEVIAGGRWESWHPSEPRELVTMVQSTEFTSAVSDKIQKIKEKFPQDKCTGMVFNGLMSALTGVCKSHSLKIFLLAPTPYYMFRISGVQDSSTTIHSPIVFKGIGGSDSDLHAELGDVIDLLGPMYHKMFKPTMNKADGIIYSNTNLGLEGDQFLQPHEPNHNTEKANYMIGPIMPPLYERALDDFQAMQDLHATVTALDPCLSFLDRHPPKSVVYIAMGSHAQLSVSQALILINGLRRYKVPWILLFRENAPALIDALGGTFTDGIITKWAPQLHVLTHPSTKLVISHGGFGTMIEGVFAGQPFITSPVASDQFIDTRVMMHLGICFGSIAENKYLSVMERAVLEPIWANDAETNVIAPLFQKVFGEGAKSEQRLEVARDASKRLRQRMIEAKAETGTQALENLRRDITAAVA